MRASFLGAFAAGLIASQVCAERLKARSWLDATPHQFSALLKENDVVLVSFQGSEVCEECTAISTAVHDVGQALPSLLPITSLDVAVATVDCSQGSMIKICDMYDVHSWPAIRLLRDDGTAKNDLVKWSRYRGARTAEAMYSFLAREVAAAVIPLMTADALQEITMLSPNVVISAAEPELSKLIKAVRSVNNGRVIVAAADEDLAQNLGPRPSLLCFKYAQSFPPKTTGGPIMPWARLHGDALNKTNSIDRFIEGCATPWIHDFSKRKVQRLYANQKPITYLVHADDTASRPALFPSARRWRDFVQFVQVDARNNSELVTALGLDPAGDLPAVAVEGVINDQVYPMPQDWAIEKDNIDTFLQGILEGKATGGREGQDWTSKFGFAAKKRSSQNEEGSAKDEL